MFNKQSIQQSFDFHFKQQQKNCFRFQDENFFVQRFISALTYPRKISPITVRQLYLEILLPTRQTINPVNRFSILIFIYHFKRK